MKKSNQIVIEQSNVLLVSDIQGNAVQIPRRNLEQYFPMTGPLLPVMVPPSAPDVAQLIGQALSDKLSEQILKDVWETIPFEKRQEIGLLLVKYVTEKILKDDYSCRDTISGMITPFLRECIETRIEEIKAVVKKMVEESWKAEVETFARSALDTALAQVRELFL